MKNILFAISLLISGACSAQVTTRVLGGFDPATGRPGYKVYDTTRTYFYQSPLYVDGDTIKTRGGGQWNKTVANNIYNSNSGKVGINDTIPLSQLTLTSNTNTTTGLDSTGILLRTPFAATSAQWKTSPPLVFEATGWNPGTTSSIRQRARFYLAGVGNLGYPNLFFQVSKDSGNTYTTVWNNSSTSFNIPTVLTGTSGSFTGTIAANGSISSGVSGAGAISTNNFAAGGVGQLSVGNLTDYTYPDAIFAMYSNSQGMLLPVLTSSQRDSINQQISSVVITDGGSGYTSAPTITIVGGTGMNARGTGGSTSGALTAVLTGGVVTSATVTRTGAYLTRPTSITFSGGGGSGATGTLVMKQDLHNGLVIFNSTINAIQYWDGTSWQTLTGSTNGTSAPTTTPTSVGQQFVDTTNKKIYVATGTSSSADWTILN